FGVITLPFKINLPKNGMPPSYIDRAGTIDYHFKTTLSWQEGLKLLKTHREIETPIQIIMPESARTRLLSNDSPLSHEVPGTDQKCGYSINIPSRILKPGDPVYITVTVNTTPSTSSIRMINVSLRSTTDYTGSERATQVKFPRPLSEATESPGISVNGSTGPWSHKFTLVVDPAIAKPSLESPLISIKTVFRLEIILDTSETPNVAVEVPVVVVPLGKNEIPMIDSGNVKAVVNGTMLPSQASGSSRNNTPDPRSTLLFQQQQQQQFNNNNNNNANDDSNSSVGGYPTPSVIGNQSLVSNVLGAGAFNMQGQQQGLDQQQQQLYMQQMIQLQQLQIQQQQQQLQMGGANLNRSNTEIVGGNLAGMHQQSQRGGYQQFPQQQGQQQGQYYNPTAATPMRRSNTNITGNNTPSPTITPQLHPSQLHQQQQQFNPTPSHHQQQSHDQYNQYNQYNNNNDMYPDLMILWDVCGGVEKYHMFVGTSNRRYAEIVFVG
ncbi:hypothetical protein HDU76_014087, partial [Blyttiomyces sp. JEL0837]